MNRSAVSRVVLAVGLSLFATGCASLVPAHPWSGFRPDEKAAPEEHRVGERTWVDVLNGAQLAMVRGDAEMEPRALFGLPKPVGDVLDWVWDLAKSQAEAELEKTLALHVSGYAGVRSGAGFYCGGAGSGTCDEPGGVQVAGFLFTREIDVSGLPKSALDDDFVADCRARRWLRERARLGAVRGERDADPEGPLTWCPAMSVAFEVDRAAAAKEGTIRVRPIRRSLAVWRARARVVDPTGYVPWTWWQNGRDAEWWAPTAGDKDYLDDVEVTLALRAVYNTALGEARTAEDAKLFERRYDFPRVRLGSPDAAEGEAVAWSEPIPLVPRSVLRDTSYDGGAVALGSGTFVVTVTVVESDSMGDFLMSDASTLIEKARAAPKTYVTDVSEGDEER